MRYIAFARLSSRLHGARGGEQADGEDQHEDQRHEEDDLQDEVDHLGQHAGAQPRDPDIQVDRVAGDEPGRRGTGLGGVGGRGGQVEGHPYSVHDRYAPWPRRRRDRGPHPGALLDLDAFVTEHGGEWRRLQELSAGGGAS